MKIEGIAKAHSDYVVILEDVRHDLKIKAKSSAVHVSKSIHQIAESSAKMKKSLEKLEKEELKHANQIRDLEIAKEYLETAKVKSPKNIDKLTIDFEKKVGLVCDSLAGINAFLRETNDLKNSHFKETLPTILYGLQKQDEINRIETIKYTFFSLANGLNICHETENPILLSFIEDVKNVSAERDTSLFVESFSAGAEVPKDIAFDDIGEIDRFKRNHLVQQMAQLNDSTLSGLNEAEEIIISLGMASKKLANDRLVYLEKEIHDVEKRDYAYSLLLASKVTLIFNQNIKEPAIQDVNLQRLNMKGKIYTLTHKRHKLQVFIANIDGQDPPPDLVMESITQVDEVIEDYDISNQKLDEVENEGDCIIVLRSENDNSLNQAKEEQGQLYPLDSKVTEVDNQSPLDFKEINPTLPSIELEVIKPQLMHVPSGTLENPHW